MWIIPDSLDVSAFAVGTKVLDWGSDECFRICESSLTRRSRSMPAPSWRRAWKRGSLMLPRFGLILEPSQEQCFTEKYTSYLADIPVNPSLLPESGREPTIPDTFGRLLQESSRQLSLFGASSRTSPDTLASDSPTFIAAYEKWVTQLRLDCLQRQRSARPTNGNGSLSWPSLASATDCGGPHGLDGGSGSRAKLKKAGGLEQQVNWPTPAAQNTRDGRANEKTMSSNSRPLQEVVVSGLPAPPSLSTTGKSRELWATPNIPDRGGPGNQHSDLSIDLHCAPRKLNPAWVEQLMGLPSDWTALPAAWMSFDSSETVVYPAKWKKRSDT